MRQASLIPTSNAPVLLPNHGAIIASFKLIKARALKKNRGIQLASCSSGVDLDSASFDAPEKEEAGSLLSKMLHLCNLL